MIGPHRRWIRHKLSRWESGKEVPTWEDLTRIGNRLGWTPQALAECDRAEYARRFPTKASRGVPLWRRWP